MTPTNSEKYVHVADDTMYCCTCGWVCSKYHEDGACHTEEECARQWKEHA